MQAIDKYHQKIGKIPAKMWASMCRFVAMGFQASGFVEWELCAMSVLSISFGLQAVEALLVAYDGENVMYMGAKRRLGARSETPGPWAREWAEFLRMLRA